ncbi:MAG: 50S ribosomal protein L13 [Chitinophagales bacterium]
MNTLSYKTKFANKTNHTKEWFIVDAEGKTLGRLATAIATVLRGKHKPTYTPHDDAGDYVIVLNSDKIKLTGNKWNAKKYITFSGYPGGQRTIVAKDLNKKKSFALVESAVRGMLPKNILGRQMIKKMFVYDGTEHPHQAQKPQTLNIK